MSYELLDKIAEYLNPINVLPTVIGFVAGALGSWGLAKLVVVRAAEDKLEQIQKAHAEYLREMKSQYEHRLEELDVASRRERSEADRRIGKLESEVSALNGELRALYGMMVGRNPAQLLS